MKINNSGLTLDELVNQITSSVDPSWSTLKKIRYVYLQLGIYLEKNEMFFMTAQNKLSNTYKLSQEEMNKIYNDDLSDGSRKDWNQVICRSAAIILSKCLTKLHIQNKMVNTTNVSLYEDEEEKVPLEIRHVFVNAKLNENESIFLTLAADLPNIQNNMETQSFGNLLNYKKEDENGNEVIMYEGDEILDAVRVDSDELKKIDYELGYLIPCYDIDNKTKKETSEYLYADAFLEKLRKKMNKNKLYYQLLINDTDLYQMYDCNYSDMTLDMSAIPRLRNLMFEICEYVSESIGFESDISNNLDFDKWSKDITDYVNNLSNDDEFDFDVQYFKDIVAVSKDVIETIANLAACILSEENTKENIVKYKNIFYKRFDHLCMQYVPLTVIPNYDDLYLNQEYIACKLEKIFQFVFECNLRKTEFNRYGYNEQIAIIRTFMPMVFSDVTDKNCKYNRRNSSMSPVFNIIRTYTLKMKSDGTYRLIFEIDNSGNPIYFSYNLSSNKFKRINQSRFYFLAVNNIVCSKDLNDKLNIENIETNDSNTYLEQSSDKIKML